MSVLFVLAAWEVTLDVTGTLSHDEFKIVIHLEASLVVLDSRDSEDQ